MIATVDGLGVVTLSQAQGGDIKTIMYYRP